MRRLAGSKPVRFASRMAVKTEPPLWWPVAFRGQGRKGMVHIAGGAGQKEGCDCHDCVLPEVD